MVKNDLIPKDNQADEANKKSESVEKIVTKDPTLPKNPDDSVGITKQKNEADKANARKRQSELKKIEQKKIEKIKKMNENRKNYVFFVGKTNLASFLLENGTKILVSSHTKDNPLKLHKTKHRDLIAEIQESGMFTVKK